VSKQILVPVDGSDHALEALNVACSLARAEGKSIKLLHVVPNKAVPDALKRYADIEHIHDTPEYLYETSIAESILNMARDRSVEAGVKDVETEVAYGDAAKGILEAVSDGDVDSVVMGTRGFSDIQGLVFGSVAHKVSHGAGCRVVTVK